MRWQQTLALTWDLHNSWQLFEQLRKFFPMNVAAFNVVAMNIPQIYWMLFTWLCNVRHSFLSVSHLVFDFVHKFCCVTAHDEIFGICLLGDSHCLRFPRSIVNHLSVPCGMRISAEKRFLTLRVNFWQYIPRNVLRFPRSIVLRSSTFPLLRRPRLTIILFWITWWWRVLKFPRSIVTCNRFSRILYPYEVLHGFDEVEGRNDRRNTRCQIYHRS